MKPVLIILILSTVSPLVQALDFTFNTSVQQESILFSGSFELSSETELIMNLEEGYQAEVRYQFRLYKRNGKFRAFTGDKLLYSTNLTLTAYKHFFFDRYVIEGIFPDGQYFSTREDFLNQFTQLQNFPLTFTDAEEGSSYYLKCRVTLVPVKLESPLDIIALFSPLSKTSEWVVGKIEG